MTTRFSIHNPDAPAQLAARQPVTVPVVTANEHGVRIARDGSVTFIAHHDSELIASEIRGALADAYFAGQKYSSHQEGPTS
jgi:hypothetical protein